MSALADDLSKIVYTIDTIGLEAAAQEGANQQTLDELSTKFLGQNFDNRRDVERIIKRLNHRPNNTRAIKAISKHFERSVLNTRYDSQDKLLTAIDNFGIKLNDTEAKAVIDVTYTGWVFTTENFKRMISLPDTKKTFINTLFYVFTTLILFNVGFALVLSISTHYMNSGPAGIFRSLWLLSLIHI